MRAPSTEARLQFSIFFIYLMAVVTRFLMLFEPGGMAVKVVPVIIMVLDLLCLAFAFTGRTYLERRVLVVNLAMGLSDALLMSLIHTPGMTLEMVLLRFELPAMLLYRCFSIEWIEDER